MNETDKITDNTENGECQELTQVIGDECPADGEHLCPLPEALSDTDDVSDEYADTEGEKEAEEESPFKKAAEAFYEIAETLLLSTAAVIILFTFFVRLAVVDGPSMRQTLEHGDVLVVSDLFYEPKYGDIVVVQKINSAWSSPIVKRVIATGGQVVDIDFETWTVTVDGKVLDESGYIYLAKDSIMTSNLEFPVTVPEGQLFVMGDNRNHSSDSRDSRIGFIDTRSVFGRVLCRVLPVQNVSIFERFS